MAGRRDFLKAVVAGGIGAAIPLPLVAGVKRNATWALDSPSWALGRIPCSATFDLADDHGIGAIPAEVKRGDYWWLCGKHADVAVMSEYSLYFWCQTCAKLQDLNNDNSTAAYHADLLIKLIPQVSMPKAMMPSGGTYALREVANVSERQMDSDPCSAIERAFSPYLFFKYMSERDIETLIAAWRVRRQGPVGLTHLDSLKRRSAGEPTISLHEVKHMKGERVASLWLQGGVQ